MKRFGHLVEQIAEYDNLALTFYKAQRGKIAQNEVKSYREKLGINLKLLSGRIMSAAFDERVLHHAIMNICQPIFERNLIYDTYATRVGKGVYAALERARYGMCHYDYVVKMDVRKYFDSISHEILVGLLNRVFKDKTLIDIFTIIINSYHTNASYYTSSKECYYRPIRISTSSGPANGFPTVTTTDATWSGSTVTTGGNVTKDGGETVIARGVCYGTQPYPDITGQHTTNGSGTGPYSSTFTISQTNVTYYIRAYATNANGTSYGEQKTVIKLNLPTFQYAGSTYYVAPDPGTTMNYGNAVSYCNNYGIYGTTGWTLPTIGELTEMYAQRNSIGGFSSAYYHSSTSSGSYYYVIHFSTGNSTTTSSQPYCRVRPIKKID